MLKLLSLQIQLSLSRLCLQRFFIPLLLSIIVSNLAFAQTLENHVIVQNTKSDAHCRE
jgi:hypothetical protein